MGNALISTERWCQGTVVRLTLTDRLDPTVDRSITLNATVVRWGNDGVGLDFGLSDGNGLSQSKECVCCGAGSCCSIAKCAVISRGQDAETRRLPTGGSGGAPSELA